MFRGLDHVWDCLLVVLSEEETFRRIGTAVRVDFASAAVWRGAAPCSGTA